MFEFLLKFSPVLYKEGHFGFNVLPSLFALLGITALLALSLWFAYRKTTLELSQWLKGMLLGLKMLVLGLLILALFEPIIQVTSVIPRKSSLILLVDDSKSMSIKDVNGGESRSAYVQKLLGDANQPGLLQALKKNFKVQTYKFASEVERLNQTAHLTAGGEITDLAASLEFAGEIGSQGRFSGVLLLTDGANNTAQDPLETAALLNNSDLPVYVVGVGSETSKDIEIAKVAANHSTIENSVVEISALVKNNNFENKEVEIELREEGLLVKKQVVKLRGSGTRVTMKFSPQKRGFVHYALNAVASENEIIKENNSKSFLIDNRHKKARVLYIEGYPRAEFKYLRRALDGDISIELVSLLRTGVDKFYRQGIKDQNELKDGYPKTKEALFKYDAIILGSIEADFFSEKELLNTQEFVSQRGGGFLMLGGVHSFNQGGYGNTPIEKILPVELPYHNGTASNTPTTFRDKFKLVLTPEGYDTAILQLATDESDNRSKWENMPELEGYNPLGRAKPGATILAVHPLSEIENPKIIMAQQRFGRGRSMVFSTSSSWLWQMGLPHEDTNHERFWRQLLRWLALSSPSPIEGRLDQDTYAPSEAVHLSVDVRDSTYNSVENATIKAFITTPSGKVISVPFNWSSNGKVEYVANYQPQEKGLHLVDIRAYSSSGKFLGKTETAFFVEESKTEFSHAQLKSNLLKRLAEISGGKYYHQDEAKILADEISIQNSSYSKLVEHDLWDVPLLFLIAIFLLTVEWFVRRHKGLS
ncbi:MAG: glutamine amidotransferase [bacterium]